jgi:hypothetical protein
VGLQIGFGGFNLQASTVVALIAKANKMPCTMPPRPRWSIVCFSLQMPLHDVMVNHSAPAVKKVLDRERQNDHYYYY